MKFRWTQKDLKKSDAFVLRGLVTERKSDLDPYTPLAQRLSKIYQRLDQRLDAEGQLLPDPTLEMLKRLTEKVERANNLQHSRKGHTIPQEDWAELFHLTNEAKSLIHEAMDPEEDK